MAFRFGRGDRRSIKDGMDNDAEQLSSGEGQTKFARMVDDETQKMHATQQQQVRQQQYAQPQQQNVPPQQPQHVPPQQQYAQPQSQHVPPQQRYVPPQPQNVPPQQQYAQPQQRYVPPQPQHVPPQQQYAQPQQQHAPPQQRYVPPQQTQRVRDEGYFREQVQPDCPRHAQEEPINVKPLPREAEPKEDDVEKCEQEASTQQDLPKEPLPKPETESVANPMLLEEEAEKRLKEVKPIAQQLLAIYDKLDFQYTRFKAPDTQPIPKENQFGFFEKLNELIEKDALKANLRIDSLTSVLGKRVLEIYRLENGYSNEQMELCFAELIANIESIAKENDLEFMRVYETCEELVTCLEVEESDENRTELIRRGMLYKDKVLKEFIRPIRYQEIKIYKNMEENKS